MKNKTLLYLQTFDSPKEEVLRLADEDGLLPCTEITEFSQSNKQQRIILLNKSFSDEKLTLNFLRDLIPYMVRFSGKVPPTDLGTVIYKLTTYGDKFSENHTGFLSSSLVNLLDYDDTQANINQRMLHAVNKLMLLYSEDSEDSDYIDSILKQLVDLAGYAVFNPVQSEYTRFGDMMQIKLNTILEQGSVNPLSEMLSQANLDHYNDRVVEVLHEAEQLDPAFGRYRIIYQLRNTLDKNKLIELAIIIALDNRREAFQEKPKNVIIASDTQSISTSDVNGEKKISTDFRTKD